MENFPQKSYHKQHWKMKAKEKHIRSVLTEPPQCAEKSKKTKTKEMLCEGIDVLISLIVADIS